MGKYISGKADAKNIEQFSNRASANSYNNSDENKRGGPANHQTKGNDWFTPRERKDYTGPATYPGSKQDRG